MENPWLNLRSQPPFVLEMDNGDVRDYNSRHGNDAKLALNLIPEPYIGDPKTAKLVLLLLNPGVGEEDDKAHADPHFRDVLFQNLRGDLRDYPFYPLNPAFRTTPSAKWWLPRLQCLMKETGFSAEVLSKKLLAIEWFPYH